MVKYFDEFYLKFGYIRFLEKCMVLEEMCYYKW